MNPHPRLRLSVLSLSLLTGLTLAHAQDAAVEVPLVNPTFKEPGADGVPAGWKASPGADPAGTSIAADSGGVKMTDSSKDVGLGLSQWIDVNPGDVYTATAEATGTGGLQLYMIFVPKIPSKEAMVGKIKLAEERVSLPTKDGTPATLTATAPEGATKARVWLYCPKIGICDVVVKSVSVKKTGSGPAPTPATAPAAGTGAKSVPDGTAGKTRNDHGKEHPDSMIQPGTVSVIDFETGDFSQVRLQEGGKKEVVSAPEPVRGGKHAMKVMMTHDKHRSEVTGLRSAPYGEFKYGWSIYLPKDFDGATFFTIITQWHSWGSGKDYVISPPGPPTCLVISKDKWDLLLRYQDGTSGNATKKNFDLGSIQPDLGKWTDFVMEVNWQSPQTGGGYLRLWKNGQQVVNYEGPTWFDDKTSGPFFKLGIYKGSGGWKGEESRAIAYFDEFRMGDKSISRDAVDPAKQSGN
jgi:hypothetical protein